MTDTHAAGMFVWLEQLGQDIRIALRTLRRNKTFALAAVSTLALGIGATTAIFGTADAARLRPLPYPDWQDLRSVRTAFTDGNVTIGLRPSARRCDWPTAMCQLSALRRVT
jgi:hypothetical protein